MKTFYSVDVYNRYHDGFCENIGTFDTYEKAIDFAEHGDFELDADSEFVEVSEVEE